MTVDLPWSGVDFVKHMNVGGDISNSWIIFVKRLKNWTTLAYYIYNTKYYKVLIFACYDMQYEDVTTQLCSKKLELYHGRE